MAELARSRKWPCYFFESDTTGEKDFEEFYTNDEVIDLERFENIGVILNKMLFDTERLEAMKQRLQQLQQAGKWTRRDLIELVTDVLPNLNHKETGKFLDARM